MFSIIDLEHIFDWLEGVIVSSWYWLVPLGTFLESTAVVSLAAPGLIILLLAGFYAGLGEFPIALVIALGILGTLVGDIASYFFGRLVWTRYFSSSRFGKALQRIAQPLVSRVIWFLPFYHFSAYGRALVPLTLGVLKTPLRRWIVFDLIGSVLWNVTFGLLGYFGGLYAISIEDALEYLGFVEWAFLAIFIAWAVGLGLAARRLIRENARETSNTCEAGKTDEQESPLQL